MIRLPAASVRSLGILEPFPHAVFPVFDPKPEEVCFAAPLKIARAAEERSLDTIWIGWVDSKGQIRAAETPYNWFLKSVTITAALVAIAVIHCAKVEGASSIDVTLTPVQRRVLPVAVPTLTAGSIQFSDFRSVRPLLPFLG
jgi:hypothetical protein